MVISHLKHSYLNWRAIPCRRRMVCVYAFFHHFFDLCLDSNEFLQCIIWQSIFFFFYSFIFSFFVNCLLWATTHVIDGLPTWSISSYVRIVLKGWPFGPKLFISFLSQEKIMARKRSQEMGNFFGQHAPRHQSGCFWNITILGICVFGHREGLASLKL